VTYEGIDLTYHSSCHPIPNLKLLEEEVDTKMSRLLIFLVFFSFRLPLMPSVGARTFLVTFDILRQVSWCTKKVC
jgi:hypothetical protein